MKNPNRLLLTAAIHGLLAAASLDTALADAKDQKIDLLEKRLRLLEERLNVTPTLNAPSKPDPVVQALDQKVKILERQNEVTKEIALEASKTAPKLDVSNKGVSFTSADGDHSVRLRASIQGDGRFFIDDPSIASSGSILNNRFDLRQARLWLEGRFWKYNDFKLMPDFGNGTTQLVDAYVDLHYWNGAALNVGRQKTPLSLERLQGDTDGMFVERAYPTYLASNRDNGVKLHGSFGAPGRATEYAGPIDFKNFATYDIGVFNGGGDNGATDTYKAAGDNKEVAGRLWIHPFQNSGINQLDNLGLGVAASYDQAQNDVSQLNNIKSAIGQNTIVDYTKLKTGVSSIAADGEHYRIYPQAYWYKGPYGLLGEYALSSQQLTGDAGRTHIKQDNSAWQIQASYVLTGENNTFQSVKPRAAFNPSKGQWGALQFAARWSELSVDKSTFQLLSSSNSVSQATAWALGFNWYLNNNTRLMADYEDTRFTGGASAAAGGNRPEEKAFATRLQIVF